MKRFARTRSENRDLHPSAGSAQCKVGSIEEDGIRYGFTTHCLIARTAPTATTIVITQSAVVRQWPGRPAVSLSIGPLILRIWPYSPRAASPRSARGPRRGAHPGRTTHETLPAACSGG